MKVLENLTFDEERSLYGERDIYIRDCAFDGPADGESALKEAGNITAERCEFNLRYPLWHCDDVKIFNCEMTENCRAALWYSTDIEIVGGKYEGIKALRECKNIFIANAQVSSPEFGWFSSDIEARECKFISEYFMLRARKLDFSGVDFSGKYSFQYIEDAEFVNCHFDTKDAFWHAKRVVVRDSVIRGEYLGWYAEDITFERCRIIGTQPLCYCKNLTMIDCEMVDADLAFEKSSVQATLTAPIISIKNPLSGRITLPSVGEIIREDKRYRGEIFVTG